MINVTLYIKLPTQMYENTSKLNGINLSQDEYNQLLQHLTKNSSFQHDETQPICEECDWNIQNYATDYANKYHAYLALAICIFGTVANFLNVIVLTRKEMAYTPINRILTGLAVADVMVMIEYMFHVYYYHIELPGKKDFPYWGAVFMLFHIHFTQVLHTVSICLTLTLAIWRYLAIG